MNWCRQRLPSTSTVVSAGTPPSVRLRAPRLSLRPGPSRRPPPRQRHVVPHGRWRPAAASSSRRTLVPHPRCICGSALALIGPAVTGQRSARCPDSNHHGACSSPNCSPSVSTITLTVWIAPRLDGRSPQRAPRVRGVFSGIGPMASPAFRNQTWSPFGSRVERSAGSGRYGPPSCAVAIRVSRPATRRKMKGVLSNPEMSLKQRHVGAPAATPRRLPRRVRRPPRPAPSRTRSVWLPSTNDNVMFRLVLRPAAPRSEPSSLPGRRLVELRTGGPPRPVSLFHGPVQPSRHTCCSPNARRQPLSSRPWARHFLSLLKCVWVAAAPVLCLHSRGTASRSTRRASGSHRRDARSPAACC